MDRPLDSRGLKRTGAALSVGAEVPKQAVERVRSRTALATRGRREEKVSRPVSRVLSWTVIPLGLASPPGSSDLPGSGSGLSHRSPMWSCSGWGLPCRAALAPRAVRSCRTVSPLPDPSRAIGGLFSVALSVGLRRPGVTWHPALWSPDFPRRARARRDCLAGSPPEYSRSRTEDRAGAERRERRRVPADPRRTDARAPSLRPSSARRQPATRSIAAMLRSTSASVVAHEHTLMRMAVRPCHTVPPHQQVPSACNAAITRWVRSASPKATST